jgi:hypothetical protein
MVHGPGVNICVGCTRGYVEAMLHPAEAPAADAAHLDHPPCSFCGERLGSSLLRFRQDKAVVCAACVHLAAAIFLERAPAADLEGQVAELERRCPDLSSPARVRKSSR